MSHRWLIVLPLLLVAWSGCVDDLEDLRTIDLTIVHDHILSPPAGADLNVTPAEFDDIKTDLEAAGYEVEQAEAGWDGVIPIRLDGLADLDRGEVTGFIYTNGTFWAANSARDYDNVTNHSNIVVVALQYTEGFELGPGEEEQDQAESLAEQNRDLLTSLHLDIFDVLVGANSLQEIDNGTWFRVETLDWVQLPQP